MFRKEWLRCSQTTFSWILAKNGFLVALMRGSGVLGSSLHGTSVVSYGKWGSKRILFLVGG